MDRKAELLASLGHCAAGFFFGALTMVVHGLAWHSLSARAWLDVGLLTLLLAVRVERRWVWFSAGLVSYLALSALQMDSPIYQFDRHLVFQSFESSFLLLVVGAALAAVALPMGLLNSLPLDFKLSPSHALYGAVALQVTAVVVSRFLLYSTSWALMRPPLYQIAMTVVFGIVPALLYTYATLAVVTNRLRPVERMAAGDVQ